MIEFKDVCKAYLRYWWVIVSLVVVAFTAVFLFTINKETYIAESTMIVEKNDNNTKDEVISASFAESINKEMEMLITHKDFANEVFNLVAIADASVADQISAKEIHENLTVKYPKNSTFFNITYVNKDKDVSKLVVDIASELAENKYKDKDDTKAQVTKVYSTQITLESKRLVYLVIGALIGLVLGIIVITFFVVFNPYVENKEMLQKEVGIKVLATFDKVKSEKNEN